MNFVHSSLPITAVSPNFWWFVFLCILTRRSSWTKDLFCYCSLLKIILISQTIIFHFTDLPKKMLNAFLRKPMFDKEEPPGQKKICSRNSISLFHTLQTFCWCPKHFRNQSGSVRLKNCLYRKKLFTIKITSKWKLKHTEEYTEYFYNQKGVVQTCAI